MLIQRHGTARRYSDSVVYAATVYLVEVPSNTRCRRYGADRKPPGQRGTAACSGRQRQVTLVDGDDLSGRYGRLRCDECGVGCLGAGRPRPDPRLCAGQTGQSTISGGNGVDRSRCSGLNVTAAVAALAGRDPAGE